MERLKSIIIGAVNILIPTIFALAVGAVFITFTGKNPFEVYVFLIQKAFFSQTGFLNTLASATPIIMTGLGIAICFKAGMYNMGIEGQMYMGAFFAAYLGFTLKGLPALLHIIICILGGMLMGMLYSLIPSILKAKFHVDEMVSTMMLNYAAQIFTKFLTNGPFYGNTGFPATVFVEDSARLPRFNPRVAFTPAFFIALFCVAVFMVIYKKMKLGYEIEAMGKQLYFSDSVGMRVDQKIIIIFLIAGAVSGIAGATEILGVHGRFISGFSANPGLGWDGMLVALLASNNPIGIIFAAILFGALKYGGTTLQTFMGVSNDTIGIIQSSLILFLSVRFIKNDSRFAYKIESMIEKITGKSRKGETVNE